MGKRTGCVGKDGYGHVRFGGKVTSAHRAAFEMANGRAPAAHVLHSCDNPLCVNPAHLSEGTHLENMKQCAERRRNRTPRPGNGRAKLSAQAVAEIRARYSSGETNKSALARHFGVTAPRIRQVIHG
jgi:hypothetical protein